MRFRNSLHLLIDNFGSVYKMLLYKIAVAVIALSISLSFIIPNVQYIFASVEYNNLIEIIAEFGTALVSGDVSYLSQFQESIANAFAALMALITSKISNIVLAVIALVFSVILWRFLDTLGHYAFGSMLNDKMNSYADISLFASLIKGLGDGSAYAIIQVLITLVYDALIVLLCYLIFFLMLSFMPLILTLFFSAAVIFMTQALKMMLLSNWMPAMVEGKMGIWQALRYSFNSNIRQKGKIFSTYLVAVYLIAVINVIVAVTTLLSGLLITLPASYLLLLCIQFVNYYTIEGKKYFVNYYKIADNRDKGEKSKFYDEDDIREERY